MSWNICVHNTWLFKWTHTHIHFYLSFKKNYWGKIRDNVSNLTRLGAVVVRIFQVVFIRYTRHLQMKPKVKWKSTK